jgi:hypothetical protein
MTTKTQNRSAVAVLDREEDHAVGLEAQTRGEVDIQIKTAKAYPRSVKGFIDTALQMATLDTTTAEACMYQLPRGGKNIAGPSVRLAEICAAAYGHMRVQARIVDQDDRFITARGEAWDVQNNVAIGFEVKRRITDKSDRTYSDDMIVVAGNAAASIALRNAIFKVIPSAFWRPIYEQARQVAIGTVKTLSTRRADLLDRLQKLGVEQARVLQRLGVRGVEDITLEHIETLIGLGTAIKEESVDIDDAFPPVVTMPQRASEAPASTGTNGGGTTAAPAPPAPAPPPAEPAAKVAEDLEQLTEVHKHEYAQRPGVFWWRAMSAQRPGVILFTTDGSIGLVLEEAKVANAAVRLTIGEKTTAGLKVTKAEIVR